MVGKKPSFDFLPLYLAHDGNKFYYRCLQGIMQYPPSFAFPTLSFSHPSNTIYLRVILYDMVDTLSQDLHWLL